MRAEAPSGEWADNVKACPHWQQIVADYGNKLLPEFVAVFGNNLLPVASVDRPLSVAHNQYWNIVYTVYTHKQESI